MKRRTEHLVEKRDGRREFLRATKLARSIHLALHSVGVDEDWRALELANVVLQALRKKRELAGEESTVVLTTSDIGDAVQHALVVTGQPYAAAAYGAVATERSRRRRSVALLGRIGGPAVAAAEFAESFAAVQQAGNQAVPARHLPQE